jgi:XTP/dITP diphosphohydrolase
VSRETANERWILASGNRGKLDELATLLADFGVTLVAQDALGIPSVDETGATFVENALLKARNAAMHGGLPALADDSGLVVDALDGAPGIRSARFAGTDASDAENVAKLLEQLGSVPADARAAHFHCTIVLLRSALDPDPVIAQGKWHGAIATTPSGSRGFGYDPVFFDPALGLTAAALDPAIKNRHSHRGKALAALAEALGRA